MSESIQKKLLRVRPPRVRITYDVETGGAMEKKELPFIVGIFADLKGDREDPDSYDPLKTRNLVDIDRDNFNDLMNAVTPRVSFADHKLKIDSWGGDNSNESDNAITFCSIDDFEPLRVVRKIPALNKLYQARSQIRGLQSKAEADDNFAKQLDALIQDSDGGKQGEQIQMLLNKAPAASDDLPALRQKLIGLQTALDSYNQDANGGDDAKKTAAADTLKKGMLSTWHLLKSDAAADAFPAAKHNAEILAQALADKNTLENRQKALKQISALQTALADDKLPDDQAKQLDEKVKAMGFADTATAKTQLAPLKVTDLSSIIGDEGNAAWNLPLLLSGLLNLVAIADSNSSPASAAKKEEEEATLVFVKYISNPAVAPDTEDNVFAAAQNIFPLLQSDATKVLLSLHYFTGVISKAVSSGKTLSDEDMKLIKVKGATALIDKFVVAIDRQLSAALSSIMHCAGFKQLEATWRGLHYLVFNTETGTMLKLRILNATKDELRKDMQKAIEFDQSILFKKIYEDEYGTYGGFPYSLLLGDYEIGRSNDDIEFLKKIAEVAAAAHAPFIAQASKDLFGLSGFNNLAKPRDLKKIFEQAELTEWREFRELEDARYVSLTMPRALLRLPYGDPLGRNASPCEGLNFEERVGRATDIDPDDVAAAKSAPDAEKFLWGNPAFLLAERITNAFSLYSWTAAIRGVEGGGLVEDLPFYTYTAANGSTEILCPTEVTITDRREKELNDLGFISLCHCKGTGKAAFFGGQTTNLPKKYFSDDANANARISAMLPYMLAASRFAHYIKVIMREKIGSFLTRANVENYLNSWIANYVLLDDNATQEVKSSYPLRAANVVVTDVPGEPGCYRATVFIKPHFQLEELTTSIRLVAQLPK